jgi:RNA polymerase sigma-70 factor (ECF subfamily)
MRQPGRYDPVRGPVIGYLFGIARHLALKRLTSSGAASLFEELAEDVETANPEAETALDSLTRTETVEAVRAAVRSLPPQYREVIVLCELQEMDYAAAAGIIQCPIGTRTGVLATDVVPASPRIDFLSLERCSCVHSVRLESDREHVRLTSLR